jgi:hypothetical protein
MGSKHAIAGLRDANLVDLRIEMQVKGAPQSSGIIAGS